MCMKWVWKGLLPQPRLCKLQVWHYMLLTQVKRFIIKKSINYKKYENQQENEGDCFKTTSKPKNQATLPRTIKKKKFDKKR